MFTTFSTIFSLASFSGSLKKRKERLEPSTLHIMLFQQMLLEVYIILFLVKDETTEGQGSARSMYCLSHLIP